MRDKKLNSAKKLKTFVEDTILPNFSVKSMKTYDPVRGIK